MHRLKQMQNQQQLNLVPMNHLNDASRGSTHFSRVMLAHQQQHNFNSLSDHPGFIIQPEHASGA